MSVGIRTEGTDPKVASGVHHRGGEARTAIPAAPKWVGSEGIQASVQLALTFGGPEEKVEAFEDDFGTIPESEPGTEWTGGIAGWRGKQRR